MPTILRSVLTLLGLLAATLLTLTLASPAALAGGGPGPSPATLDLDAFTLTPDMAVQFDGTLTCAQAADITVDMRVQQGPEARFVSVHQQAQVRCEPGVAYPVQLVFDPAHPALFHPGALVVGIELEGWILPGEPGEGTHFTQFGIVDVDVRF